MLRFHDDLPRLRKKSPEYNVNGSAHRTDAPPNRGRFKSSDFEAHTSKIVNAHLNDLLLGSKMRDADVWMIEICGCLLCGFVTNFENSGQKSGPNIETWNPNDLYFWRSTPQNKAFSNQNKGPHLGSRNVYEWSPTYFGSYLWRFFLATSLTIWDRKPVLFQPGGWFPLQAAWSPWQCLFLSDVSQKKNNSPNTKSINIYNKPAKLILSINHVYVIVLCYFRCPPSISFQLERIKCLTQTPGKTTSKTILQPNAYEKLHPQQFVAWNFFGRITP